MERLFRYYKERDNITISDRPDGSRLLIISDIQFPFADEPLLKAVNRFIADWKPNDIIYNGDCIDCYEISDFDKRPERLFNLQDEFEMMIDLMHEHRRCGARLWFIEGNHEERMNRAIWRKAAGFSFMVADIPEALKLDELTDGFVPYGKHIDYLGFTVTHGNVVSQYSAYTARRHYDKYHSSGANGHTHRLGSYSHTDMRGRSHTWFETGCLCRRDMEYVKGTANWQHGFLIGEVHNGALHPSLVRVVETNNGRGFLAAGKYYRIT